MLRKLASDTYCQGGGVPNCEYMSAAASMTEIRERLSSTTPISHNFAHRGVLS
jgi:hypothetical protein